MTSTGARKKPVTGFHRTARLADVVGSTWGPGPRKPSLGTRANRSWLLSCRLSLATSTPPHIAPFSAPLHTETGPRPPSVPSDNRRPKAGGSASPKGEARREAPARQSEANAAPGRITGGGGRGGVTKPYHATPPKTAPRPKQPAAAQGRHGDAPPPTSPTGSPRQREPAGRSPARTRRQGRAKRTPRQGGLRVGVGGAVSTKPYHAPPQDPPPKHPRQHKPNGDTRSPNTRGSTIRTVTPAPKHARHRPAIEKRRQLSPPAFQSCEPLSSLLDLSPNLPQSLLLQLPDALAG